MKKNLTKIFAITTLTFSFFACSKKVQTFQFGQPYYQAPTTASTATPAANSNLETAETNALTSSAENDVQSAAATQLSDALVAAKQFQATATTTPSADKVSEKPSLKQKMLTKYLNKKVQKLNKENGRSGVSGNLRLGIILAAIGLILCLVATVAGGAGVIFWLLGIILLVIGLILILLELV